jgi:hypothetical protein
MAETTLYDEPNLFCSSEAILLPVATKGEPSGVQTLWYSCALLGALKGSTIPFKINHHFFFGT